MLVCTGSRLPSAVLLRGGPGLQRVRLHLLHPRDVGSCFTAPRSPRRGRLAGGVLVTWQATAGRTAKEATINQKLRIERGAVVSATILRRTGCESTFVTLLFQTYKAKLYSH